ncbi:hypothetical protein OnM2_014037, partial [Erysiphe neolycopersici]
ISDILIINGQLDTQGEPCTEKVEFEEDDTPLDLIMTEQQKQEPTLQPLRPAAQQASQPVHTTVITRKETSWPRWDGNRESYSDYWFKLEIKVEEDGQLFSSSRAVCLGMIESLPEGKRHKVKTLFRSRGSGGNYSWK